ncbi:MAG: murein L,D-transpeptidase catalytic domain family protein [Rhodanobacteraceae bacterium]
MIHKLSLCASSLLGAIGAMTAHATTPRARADAVQIPASIRAESADLARLAPDADPEVLSLAIAAMKCAQSDGVGVGAARLAVIDYSRPSLQPRLWVFDLAADKLVFEEVVAHGRGSGDDVPTQFSNREGSHESSIGLFVTADTYSGHNGYSLRMRGLEPGVNDQAMPRAIVMHGADYVDVGRGQSMGRLGRSWGCPAVRKAVAKPMIDLLKDGQFLFSYYPDTDWLQRSALLHCPALQASAAIEAKAAPLR